MQLLLALVFVGGVLVGWMLLGWWLFPVEWRNAGPRDLARGFQVDYLAMVADSYGQSGDLDLARRRLEGFTPEQIREMADYLEEQEFTTQAALLRHLAQVVGEQPVPTTAAPVAPTTEPGQAEGQTPAAATTWGQRLRFIGGVVLLAVLLIIGIVVGAAWLSRTRPSLARPTSMAGPRTEAAPSWVFGEVILGYSAPAGFVAENASYKESFQIKDQFQEVVGECGLKVAEGVDVIQGNQVPALEVWLYDKEDGRTVSTILLSEHAFRDAERFAQPAVTAGRVEQAEAQRVLHLETANLRLEAEILAVSYVEAVGGVPPNAYFAGLDVQMTPTAKEQGPEESWQIPATSA